MRSYSVRKTSLTEKLINTLQPDRGCHEHGNMPESSVRFIVPHMTDHQILWAATIFKYMKNVPEIDVCPAPYPSTILPLSDQHAGRFVQCNQWKS